MPEQSWTNIKKNTLKFASKRRDSQLEIALEAIGATIARRIEMFCVFHVSENQWDPFRLIINLDTISADNFRPYLTSFQGNAFTDYINAVFVDVSFLLP